MPTHTTHDYHRHGAPDLMTELTICESFASIDSPYMIALDKPRPYGSLIGDFLLNKGLLKSGSRILEAGGGYGTLMKGLLGAHADLIESVVMADLSMHLLKKQRDALSKWDMVNFIQTDVLNFIDAITNIDLIIINEVIGDLEVATEIDAFNLPHNVHEFVNKYNLDVPGEGRFNFNLGAARLAEAIAKKNIPAFISEHSSDPIIPADMCYLEDGLSPDSYPREIRLHNHSEYTIRFSHLMRIAEAYGRNVTTGSLAELVGLKNTPEMKFIFANKICGNDRQEIIYELLDHIREYQMDAYKVEYI